MRKKNTGTVDNAVCFVPDYPEYPEYPEYPTDDSECPWDATEISFLPGDYCELCMPSCVLNGF